jgi:hypothetical protein
LNWDFCCFWWGPGTAFKVDSIIDEKGMDHENIHCSKQGGKSPAMFLSDQEKGILLDMRKYKDSFASQDPEELISTIQLCATVSVHNVSFAEPNPAEIQVTMDIEYEDESYLRDQTISYVFDASVKRGKTGSYVVSSTRYSASVR